LYNYLLLEHTVSIEPNKNYFKKKIDFMYLKQHPATYSMYTYLIDFVILCKL